MMKSMLSALVAIGALVSSSAYAIDEYNKVPAGEAQYTKCISDAMKKYEGGEEASPIPGQNKAQAWCTCLWNETPNDFTGGLVKFSESAGGAKTNKTCEKYANWGN